MSTPRIGFVSLGCPKALVDSERIMTRLRSEGYDLVPSYSDADLVVVNTCGFIDSAVEESLDAIGEAMKENGKVVVTGCLGAREDEIRARHPGVLKITGAHAYEEVMTAVHEHLPPRHDPFVALVPPQGIKLTPRHYAYLKISEGCNHRCTFCIIPSMRGDLVSRPAGEVMGEAERLVAAGVKELLVVSQDTSAYGVDMKYRADFWNGRPVKTRFYDLASALGELGAWVRMHYVYPYPHVDEVIPLMAAGKILPYLDIPFQHASERILKLMKRPAASEDVLTRIRRWREICPELTLRSTFIVGFPGETEEDFQATLQTVERLQFDNAFVFRYSKRKDTPAAMMEDQISETVKEERNQRLLEVVDRLAKEKNAAIVGTVQRVLCEGPSKHNPSTLSGRTPQNKIVIFEGDVERLTGEILDIEIKESTGFTTYGVPVMVD